MKRGYISQSISAKLTFPFAVVFIFVLVGLILFASTTRFTARQMEVLHEQSEHVQEIYRMHGSTYHLILSAHHFLLTKEIQFVTEFNNRLEELTSYTEEYIKMEEDKAYPQAEREIALVKDIQEGLGRLRVNSVELFSNFSATGVIDPVRMESLEFEAYNIEFKVGQVNKLHRQIISDSVSATTARVGFLFRLFIIYFLLGAILLVLVNMIAMRYVVGPVRKLARATEDLAGGNLRRRVNIESGDEVGALARSFNEMAERLEAHDREQHDFSMELERKVRERTRELEQTTEHLRATQTRLVRMEQQAAVGRLAAGVTHEIRTPLNSLAINIHLLRRQLQENEKFGDNAVEEAFSVIDLEVTRVNRVLEEFVAYARFPEPKLKRIDINPLVEQVARFLAPEAAETGKTMETDLHPDLPPLEADEEQIRQVLINLCANALQAMPKGGAVTLETEPLDDVGGAGPGVMVRVSDQGEGIPPDVLNRIFEPFYSTKPDGLGLGLAIVARIVDQHNGRISCRSELGRGTTFDVLLPASQSMPDRALLEQQ